MKYAIIIALVALLSIGLASAYWYGGVRSHHSMMEEIAEEGTYQNFMDYNEETGGHMMLWIENEEEFKQWQEWHEKVEERHENNLGRRIYLSNMLCNFIRSWSS